MVIAAIGLAVGLNLPKSKQASAQPPGLPKYELTANGTKLVTGQQLNTGDPSTWALPADPRPFASAADVGFLRQEMVAAGDVHYHAHLDIIDGTQKVTVPQFLGIAIQGNNATGFAFLHTHDTSGIIHIESPKNTKFTLGQVFIEWGVRLSPTCMGGLCAGNGKVLKVFVDGKAYPGNPQNLVLLAHQEIALWYGDATATPNVPKSYTFPARL